MAASQRKKQPLDSSASNFLRIFVFPQPAPELITLIPSLGNGSVVTHWTYKNKRDSNVTHSGIPIFFGCSMVQFFSCLLLIGLLVFRPDTSNGQPLDRIEAAKKEGG